MEVPRGTKVHPVPMDRFRKHREILEDSGLDDTQRVQVAKHQLLKEERHFEVQMERANKAQASAGSK